MKKSLIVALFILSPLFCPLPARAQEKPTTTSAPSPTPTIGYELPYPGILPDSPVYILKAIRDKIEGFFIGNPFKKTEFNITKADTRMSAALSLIEQKKNIPLSITTMSKAENYFEEALNKTYEASAQGIDVQDLVKRLSLANKKHQEVLKKIENKIDKNLSANWREEKQKLELVKKRIESLGKEVAKIRL